MRKADTEQAILNMLQRYEVTTMDEILSAVESKACVAGGRPLVVM